jgi:hypothetical protein
MVIEIVDLPIINGVFPLLCNKLPEAIHKYPGSKKSQTSYPVPKRYGDTRKRSPYVFGPSHQN